jgi:hypothetical protein
MEKKSGIIIYLLITASLLLITTPKTPATYVTYAASPSTIAEITSNVTSLGPSNAINKTFKVSFVIQNVTNLYGVDIQVGWNTTYIQYVSHIKTIPVETYPTGILHANTIPVLDIVNESDAGFGGSYPGTMYWLSEASRTPAPVFNGSGTAFTMIFKVKKHPYLSDTDLWINMTSVTLADVGGSPIDHTEINCHIILYGQLQPAGPAIQVSTVNHKGTVPYTFDTNVSILNLDPYWDFAGFDIQLSYEPEVIEATKISIDPDGWFNASWPNGKFVVMNLTDNINGKVWVAILGLPGENETHTPLSGSAVLFTVTFTAYASDPLIKITDPFSLAAFPHPERPEPPFNGLETSVPIPYNTTDGFAHIIGVIQHTPLTGYTVTTESNSSVSSLSFLPGIPMITFNVTGPHGYIGFCNVTIPKDLMWSSMGDTGWIVQVDGQTITPTISGDANNTYIYFVYQQSTHYVTIVTSNVVPEFSFIGLITLMMSALAIVLIKKSPILKKK